MMPWLPRWLHRIEWLGYGPALLSVALVSLAIGVVIGSANIANISMLYLIPILASATFFGRGPAVLAACTSFLTFNWFFIEPLHTFNVADPEQWIALILFLVTALVTSQLAASQRLRAQQAEMREREAVILYDMVRLLGEADLDDALEAVLERLRKELGLIAASIDLANGRALARRAIAGNAAAIPPPDLLSNTPLEHLAGSAAPTKLAGGKPGRWVRVIPPHTSHVKIGPSNGHLHVVGINGGIGAVGVISLVHPLEAGEFAAAEDRLLSAVASQVALAVERRRLRQESTDAEVLRRADELKTALLNAVSHDLKTPLVSILASAGALLQDGVSWSEQERREFILAIEQEVKRLNQLVGNLLDLSRIESGHVELDKGWYDLGVLVDEVLGRLRWLTRGHRLRVDIPEDLPPIPLAYTEIDQVLSNLIENAVKFSPPGTEILMSAKQAAGEVQVEVADNGPGIPSFALSKIFEPFFRVRLGVSSPKGTGVGLAVARGLVLAHGGRIWAENRPEGGARFVFTLPLADQKCVAKDPEVAGR